MTADRRRGGWDRVATRRRFLVATAGLATTAACRTGGRSRTGGGAAATPAARGAPQSGGTLNSMQAGNPVTFDPQRTTSFFTDQIAGGVLSRLLRFKTGLDPKVGENHAVESDLAATVESPDAVTWTIKLRPDAKFQDTAPVSGRAVEAEDVKGSFVRAAGPDNPGRGGLGMIDPAQIEAPSKDQVVFKLKIPYAPFPSTLASPTYSWVLPREAIGGAYDPSKQMIGSGPFMIDGFTPDVAVIFRKNPGWFEHGQPYVDSVHYAIIPNTAQRMAQFLGGNLDELTITGVDVQTVRKSAPKAQIATSSGNSGDVIYFQLGDPSSAFQDVRVRRAFSMAVDRDALSKAVYSGEPTEVAFYMDLSMGDWSIHMDELPSRTGQYFRYNPAAAKQLLSEAGVLDRPFKFVYIPEGYSGQDYVPKAQTIYNMLTSAGIKATLVGVDYQKDFIGGGKGIRYGNYDKDTVVFAGISKYTNADEYLFGYYDSKGTSGLSRLHDSILDGMIEKARTVVNQNEQLNAYKDVQKYIADHMYTVTGLPAPHNYVALQPRVQNYQFTPSYGYIAETYPKLWLTKS